MAKVTKWLNDALGTEKKILTKKNVFINGSVVVYNTLMEHI